jgi:hypothetical protein
MTSFTLGYVASSVEITGYLVEFTRPPPYILLCIANRGLTAICGACIANKGLSPENKSWAPRARLYSQSLTIPQRQITHNVIVLHSTRQPPTPLVNDVCANKGLTAISCRTCANKRLGRRAISQGPRSHGPGATSLFALSNLFSVYSAPLR